MSESEIVKLIRLAAAKRGWLFYDMRRSGVRGVADVYIVSPHGPHWIEIKTKNDRLHESQKRFIAAHGYRYATCFHEMETPQRTARAVEDVFESLDQMWMLW